MIDKIIKQLEGARDRIQKQIDELKSGRKIVSGQKIVERPCTHASPTGQKVKCSTCGGAEYIYCDVKKMKINENLCNSKCKEYQTT